MSGYAYPGQHKPGMAVAVPAKPLPSRPLNLVKNFFLSLLHPLEETVLDADSGEVVATERVTRPLPLPFFGYVLLKARGAVSILRSLARIRETTVIDARTGRIVSHG